MQHGGIEGILESGQFPGTRIQRPIERIDPTLARFPGDPAAYCSTHRDREEKAKRAGHELVDVEAIAERAERQVRDSVKGLRKRESRRQQRGEKRIWPEIPLN